MRSNNNSRRICNFSTSRTTNYGNSVVEFEEEEENESNHSVLSYFMGPETPRDQIINMGIITERQLDFLKARGKQVNLEAAILVISRSFPPELTSTLNEFLSNCIEYTEVKYEIDNAPRRSNVSGIQRTLDFTSSATMEYVDFYSRNLDYINGRREYPVPKVSKGHDMTETDLRRILLENEQRRKAEETRVKALKVENKKKKEENRRQLEMIRMHTENESVLERYIAYEEKKKEMLEYNQQEDLERRNRKRIAKEKQHSEILKQMRDQEERILELMSKRGFSGSERELLSEIRALTREIPGLKKGLYDSRTGLTSVHNSLMGPIEIDMSVFEKKSKREARETREDIGRLSRKHDETFGCISRRLDKQSRAISRVVEKVVEEPPSGPLSFDFSHLDFSGINCIGSMNEDITAIKEAQQETIQKVDKVITELQRITDTVPDHSSYDSLNGGDNIFGNLSDALGAYQVNIGGKLGEGDEEEGEESAELYSSTEGDEEMKDGTAEKSTEQSVSKFEVRSHPRGPFHSDYGDSKKEDDVVKLSLMDPEIKVSEAHKMSSPDELKAVALKEEALSLSYGRSPDFEEGRKTYIMPFKSSSRPPIIYAARKGSGKSTLVKEWEDDGGFPLLEDEFIMKKLIPRDNKYLSNVANLEHWRLALLPFLMLLIKDLSAMGAIIIFSLSNLAWFSNYTDILTGTKLLILEPDKHWKHPNQSEEAYQEKNMRDTRLIDMLLSRYSGSKVHVKSIRSFFKRIRPPDGTYKDAAIIGWRDI